MDDNDNFYLILYCLLMATAGLLLGKLEPMQWVGLTGPHIAYLVRGTYEGTRMLR